MIKKETLVNLEMVGDAELRKAMTLVMENGYGVLPKSKRNIDAFMFKSVPEAAKAIGWDIDMPGVSTDSRDERTTLYYKGWFIASFIRPSKREKCYISTMEEWIFEPGDGHANVYLCDDDINEAAYTWATMDGHDIYESTDQFSRLAADDIFTIDAYQAAIKTAKEKQPMTKAAIDMHEEYDKEVNTLAVGVAAKMQKLDTKYKLKVEALKAKIKKD